MSEDEDDLLESSDHRDDNSRLGCQTPFTPDLDGLIGRIDEDTSCVVVQYPDILGRLTDLEKIAEAAHAKGALLIAVNLEPVALGSIKSPGELGADIVVGEGQALGVGLQFGGPYLGLFAVRDQKHVRMMPGRLCGETCREALSSRSAASAKRR